MLIDAVFGDPRRGHPVAGFGRLARVLERRLYRDSRVAGSGFAVLTTALPLALALGIGRHARRSRWRALLLSAGVWASIGGTSLTREGRAMAQLLARDDLVGARRRLSHLCARESADLDPAALARATVESIAENTSDAVVAPLFWAALAGLPGVVSYRAINTLDAMVGYRNERYRRFGWASARLDDVANLAPARICAALACLLAPTVTGSPLRAAAVTLRDGGAHPSPNAGRCEAAFAGALGLTLGGSNVYSGRTERRSTLGAGRPPEPSDIPRAIRLSRSVSLASAVVFGIGLGSGSAWLSSAARSVACTTQARARRRPCGAM